MAVVFPTPGVTLLWVTRLDVVLTDPPPVQVHIGAVPEAVLWYINGRHTHPAELDLTAADAATRAIARRFG